MMYVVIIVDNIHHLLNKSKTWILTYICDVLILLFCWQRYIIIILSITILLLQDCILLSNSNVVDFSCVISDFGYGYGVNLLIFFGVNFPIIVQWCRSAFATFHIVFS